MAEAEYQRAETEARARRRLRWLVAGLGVTLALTLLAALLAIGQGRVAERQATAAVAAQATAVAERSRAENQAQLALSRQLAAQAISLVDEELDTALLLSLESLRLSPSGADRTALLAELPLPPLISTMFHGPAEPVQTWPSAARAPPCSRPASLAPSFAGTWPVGNPSALSCLPAPPTALLSIPPPLPSAQTAAGRPWLKDRASPCGTWRGAKRFSPHP